MKAHFRSFKRLNLSVEVQKVEADRRDRGVVERLGHFHKTFACANMASAPKPVVEILRKRTVVINIEYGQYSLNFVCSSGPNTFWKMLKIAFPSI